MVKKGYKQTEIGVIPEDWEIKEIKRISPLQRGFDLPYLQIKDGSYPVIFSNGVGAYHAQYMVKGPGVVTGRSGTIGKVHYVGENYWPHNTSLWVTNFFGNYPKYIYYLFNTINWELYNSGSGVPTLNRNDIHDLKCAIPSVEEQKCIAEALSDVDSMISSLEKLIEKKKAVKQGAMQELLTGKKRLPGFTGEWMSILFKDIYEFAKEGGTPSTSNVQYYHNGKIPFIKIEHLFSKYIEAGKEFITEEGLNNSSAWLIPTESIIFSNGATIGEISINKIPVSTKQGILGIIPKELFLTEFLFYYLSHQMFLNSVKSVTTHGTMDVAYLKDMNNILLYVPKDKKEQIAIATYLADIDNEIEALEQKLAKTRQIKQGMMQKLLTGKIRLV